jgi:hypothetical protein
VRDMGYRLEVDDGRLKEAVTCCLKPSLLEERGEPGRIGSGG